MMTNTFTPHVGGVARSVEHFTAEYRKRGHQVLIVAPVFDKMPEEENNVVRIHAIQHFNGSDFSVVLPASGLLDTAIDRFNPDIIHSHHPFLLGLTALRLAGRHKLPLVFTHHTMYEQYTHYVPGDSKRLKKFVSNLATNYANLCNQVIAPSESIKEILVERGVTTKINVVPTGVQIDNFKQGSGTGMRMVLNIPPDAFAVGHLGRLAPEKNLEFLTESVALFLKKNPKAHFLLVGTGPSLQTIEKVFDREGLHKRFHYIGLLEQPLLAGAYRAMDVFAFASKSETQGMVVTEAMAAGVPVVALDAPGVREVITDDVNGRLLFSETTADFSSALEKMAALSSEELQNLKREALKTADLFSLSHSAEKALLLYEELEKQDFIKEEKEYQQLEPILSVIRSEWDIVKNIVDAAGAALDFHDKKS